MDVVTFAVRQEERDDYVAFARVRGLIGRVGLRIDESKEAVVRRNGGLWQYVIPVRSFVSGRPVE